MWNRIKESCRNCIFSLCFSDTEMCFVSEKQRDVIMSRHETKNSKNKGTVT